MKSTHGGPGRKGTAAVAENADPARVEAAIRRVVEGSSGFAVSKENRAWIAEDVSRGPRYELK